MGSLSSLKICGLTMAVLAVAGLLWMQARQSKYGPDRQIALYYAYEGALLILLDLDGETCVWTYDETADPPLDQVAAFPIIPAEPYRLYPHRFLPGSTAERPAWVVDRWGLPSEDVSRYPPRMRAWYEALQRRSEEIHAAGFELFPFVSEMVMMPGDATGDPLCFPDPGMQPVLPEDLPLDVTASAEIAWRNYAILHVPSTREVLFVAEGWPIPSSISQTEEITVADLLDSPWDSPPAMLYTAYNYRTGQFRFWKKVEPTGMGAAPLHTHHAIVPLGENGRRFWFSSRSVDNPDSSSYYDAVVWDYPRQKQILHFPNPPQATASFRYWVYPGPRAGSFVSLDANNQGAIAVLYSWDEADPPNVTTEEIAAYPQAELFLPEWRDGRLFILGQGGRVDAWLPEAAKPEATIDLEDAIPRMRNVDASLFNGISFDSWQAFWNSRWLPRKQREGHPAFAVNRGGTRIAAVFEEDGGPVLRVWAWPKDGGCSLHAEVPLSAK